MATVLASFTTLSAAPSDPQRALTGYHWTFAVCDRPGADRRVLAFLMIRDEDAAATMRPRATRAVAATEPFHQRLCRRHLDQRHGSVTPSVRAGSTAGEERGHRRGRQRRRVAVDVVAEALLALGDRAGADALERGERPALVGRDPDVDHRRLAVLDERRAGTSPSALVRPATCGATGSSV